MGQTLTHGIYLPDEGERNCYNGLAANWQLLDNSVGTVAEHTSALAGKAPLVHTHTKADITDFPVYGTTAGTICEGNDSRLSDARTPVAHTHVTADVTDLLNSAHTWTGDNTFSKTVAIERSTDTGNFLALKNTVAELGSTPASATPATIAFRDKNDDNLGYMGVYYDTDGSNHFRLYVRNKFTSGAPSTSGSYDYAFFGLRLNADKSKEGIIKATFRPYDNNTYDLGSSSYQWNNVYSKGYYYNGTPWGLNKSNTWTTYNTFTGDASPIRVRGSSSDVYNVQPQTAIYSQITFVDKNNTAMSYLLFQHRSDATETHRICLRQNKITSDSYYSVNLNNLGDFYPEQNNEIDLGTSTNKWKSLNGINPGALSLPDQDANSVNLSGNITVLDGSASNDLTQTVNGWLFIYIENTTGAYIRAYIGSGSGTRTIIRGVVDAEQSQIYIFAPIFANITVSVYVKATSIGRARFYPCLGNV